MTSHIDSDTGTDSGMRPTVTLHELAAAGDQPGWRVLDTARTQQFIGEIAFQTQPPISVYFDGGMAYHAVRAGDPSLCTRLVDAGVVEPAQVERGVIRVGNVENLGRLFDRDPSIDRDAVMVVLELATDDVVTAIANTVSGPFALTAYRHHVSGVHRWFVSPGGTGEQPAQLTPVGQVAQIDGSVTDDLPGLEPTPIADDVQIEWDQPISSEPEVAATLHSFDDDLLSRLLGEIDEPLSTDAPAVAPALIDDVTPEAVTLEAVTPEAVTPAVPAVESELIIAAPPTAEPTLFAEHAPIPTTSVVEPDSIVAATSAVSPGDQDSDVAALDQDVTSTPAASNDDFQILWPDGSEQHLADIDISTIDDSIEQAIDSDETPADDTPAADTSAADTSADETPEADWPTVDAPIVETAAVAEYDTAFMPSMTSIDDLAYAAAADDVSPDDVSADDVSADDVYVEDPEPEAVESSTSLSFDMPSLTLTADNVPDEEQPEEVVDAVRRALEAIESASTGPTQLPSVDVDSLPPFQPTTPLEFDVVDPLAHEADGAPTAPDSTTSPISTPTQPDVFDVESVLPLDALQTAAPESAVAQAPAPAGLGGFAAPTMNDSAEAVYARTAAVEQPSAGPASGIASVVFVDEASDESDDRSGALKRLIGSLRRK